jgi:putative salt-induced outer membrane protein YdiY
MFVDRSARRWFLAAVVLLAHPASAGAQAAQEPPPPPPKQEGTAEIAYVGTSGNSETSTFSLGGEHIFRPPQWQIRNRARMIRTETENELAADSLLYAFRAERIVNTRITAFGDYGYFHDRPAGVEHRNGVTGGLAVKVLERARQSLRAEAGAGYLNEQRLTGDDVSSAVYDAGTTYKLKLSETSELADEIRFLGTFDNSDDWRFAHAIGLTVAINTVFSLKASSTLRYANFPPPGFEKTDTTTAIALVASFKRQ